MSMLVALIALLIPAQAPAPAASRAGAAGPPASRPSATPLTVEQLVRDLNHPQIPRREAAARGLISAGSENIAKLEALLPQQPFETQAAIRKVLQDLRWSEKALLVTYVVARSQAARWNMSPGDLLLAVNGKAIGSLEEFTAEEDAGRREEPRVVRVRRSDSCFDMKAVPGLLGVGLCDFDGAWGRSCWQALKDAQANDYVRSWKQFSESEARGAPLFKSPGLRVWYMTAGYYGRLPADRGAWLDAMVQRIVNEDRLQETSNALESVMPNERHLKSAILERAIALRPEEGYLHQWQAAQATFFCNNPPLGIAEALQALRYPKNRTPEGEALALYALANGLSTMGMEAESTQVLQRLARHPRACERWAWAKALCYDLPERRALALEGLVGALKKHEELESVLLPSEEQTELMQSLGNVHSYLTEGAMRVALLEQKYDVFEEALWKHQGWLTPSEYQTRWKETAPIWRRYGLALSQRGSLEEEDVCLASLLPSLFEIPDPDSALIERLLGKAKAPPGQNDIDRDMFALWRARSAALAGRYDDAIERYRQLEQRRGSNMTWTHAWGFHQEFEAVRYLAKNHALLTGRLAPWAKLRYAYPAGDGKFYLLTREHRIGYATADARDIREIPIPEAGWWPCHLSTAIQVSPSGKTVVSLCWGRIFCLKPDRSGWTLLTVTTPWKRWDTTDYGAWLDAMASEFVKREAADRAIIYPEFMVGGRPRRDPYVLQDGTCLVPTKTEGVLQNAAEGIAAVAGTRPRIYEFRFSDDTMTVLYFATDRGLFKWSITQNKARAMPFRDGSMPPVRFMWEEHKNPQAKNIKVGALPGAGGQVGYLHLEKGELNWAQGLNGVYPEAHWKHMPQAERTALVKAAVQKAGLPWPIVIPASTQPAK